MHAVKVRRDFKACKIILTSAMMVVLKLFWNTPIHQGIIQIMEVIQIC